VDFFQTLAFIVYIVVLSSPLVTNAV